MNTVHVRITLFTAFALIFSSFTVAQSSNTMTKEQLMREMIRFSEENVTNSGGSFRTVIARDGKITAMGMNRVTSNNASTTHTEVSAIRMTCEKLETFDLSRCEIFTSCEPYLM